MNERDSGSIGRVSGSLQGGVQGAYRGQQSERNIVNFDDFDKYSNGALMATSMTMDYLSGKLDSAGGVSSGFNKNSAFDGFSFRYNHMFDFEEDNED